MAALPPAPPANPDRDRRYVLDYFARDARRYDRNERLRTRWRVPVLAAARVQPGDAVLDVCTGTGELALALARQGAGVTAVDLSPHMLAVARRKGEGTGVTFLEADATALPFPDRSFAVCTCFMGLHCMPPDVRRGVLRELGRLARDRVVLWEPNTPVTGLGRWLLRTAGRLTDAPRFWPEFITGAWRAALAEAGLAVASEQVHNWGVHRLTVCRPLPPVR